VGDLRTGREQHLDERGLTKPRPYNRRVPTIVVPYRGDAKRRLPASIRAAAAIAMLGDVVEAALEVGPVLVVTDDLALVPRGAGGIGDPGGGLGPAVATALERVEGHTLVVNADLPLATPAAIRQLAYAGLALVEAADGTTNALSLPDPARFAPLYGPGSAARFRAHAPFATAVIPELAEDVDTRDDLERLAPSSGPRTRSLIAVHV
jgi:2-phospho-L-lactate guanylyltransferase (CobY/MobA/RfbA family)